MDKIALKEFLQKKYESPSAFLENVIFPVFGEENYDSSGNYHWLHKHPEDQTAADNAGIVDILVLGSLYVESSQLDLFDITVSSKRQLTNSRVGIQQLVRRIISSHSGAFMIFHYQTTEHWDWRFTFCHKGANQLDSSDTKRYTFLLGPGQSCRTAAENFFKLGEKISGSGEFEMEDIIKAFDVEALSKEFFAKYKVHYERFCQFVYDNKDNREYFGPEFSAWEDKIIRDYVKKLLGRIVFLHFLQKKGWLGVPAGGQWGDGDPQFMKHLFEASSDEQKQNYLDAVLEPLFSGALNVQRENDVFNLNVPGYTEIRIPYLNGGLFERDELDEPASAFPAEYFADLFEFFYQYNFTIDENDPDDAEVGIDPEMLGRIFENLLEDNKDKGAYYTPKEIVQYMCRESLIAYLTTCFMERNGSFTRDSVETEVRRLVKDPETKVPGMKQQAKEDFGNDLRKVHICDPAIGSGAFPMGLLNELVRCRVSIDAWAKDNSGRLLTGDYAALKREIINNNIYGVDIERGAIDIARLRFWLSIVVDEQEPQPLPNLDYKFMQGNSLITTFNGEYINLDTKSQQHVRVEDMKREKARLYGLKQRYYSANGESKYQLDIEIKDSILSLISMQLGYEIRTWYDKNAEQLALFPDDSPKQLSFADMKEQLPADKQKVLDLGASLRKQLSDTSKPLAVRAQTDIRFFDWRIMFTEVFEGENPGFDIVIGNPPYIQLQTDIHRKGIDSKGKEYDMKLGDLYKDCNFATFEKTGDIYCLFYEHGMNLLKKKGVLCYITSNKWMRASYGKTTRNFFAKKCNPKLLLDFTGTKIFENATVDVNILLLTNDENIEQTKCAWLSEPECINDLYSSFNSKCTEIAFVSSDAWTIIPIEDTGIKRKIEIKGKPLGNWDLVLTRGVGTGFDEAYVLNEEQKEGLLNNCSTEEELERTKSIIHPMLRGREISKYNYSWGGLWMVYIPIHFPLNDNSDIKGASSEAERKFEELYPAVYKHICKYKAKLSSRDKTETGIRYEWYCMQRARIEKFGKLGFTKIIYQELSQGSTFAFDEDGIYMLNNSAYYIHSQEYDKYLIALLNSKLIEYAYSTYYCTRLGKSGVRWLAQNIVNLPIVVANKEMRATIESLVDRILSAKKTNPQADTSDLENEIDNIVYHLYSLTYDEVLVIDPETPITREEYDNFRHN
ncbi:MAG: Eco57I restriction-modification methylase domain-containing protein [Bacteroidaceae bacterium]|nr:Eco57I restriction-modification methylase domain-containing protein [Bacteroidaceae bacterium]